MDLDAIDTVSHPTRVKATSHGCNILPAVLLLNLLLPSSLSPPEARSAFSARLLTPSTKDGSGVVGMAGE